MELEPSVAIILVIGLVATLYNYSSKNSATKYLSEDYLDSLSQHSHKNIY